MDKKRRLHIHISVENLEKSMAFYNIQFGAKPTKIKEDYIQWLVDDLSLNFAISTRGYEKGLNHLGVQYESDAALLEAQHTFETAGIEGEIEDATTCCYKESNKYWVTDPTNIIWENYHSMNDIEVFGLDAKNTQDGCCIAKKTESCGCSA
ncbi:MAG: ArsI/CadI family heavy metal resistance metalloenzyme [Sulfurimonas sp.]|jgi:predicted enzyme related to lactoylglutathione lyase